MRVKFVAALLSLAVSTEVLASQAPRDLGIVQLARQNSAFRSRELGAAAFVGRGARSSQSQSRRSVDDVRLPPGRIWVAVPEGPKRTGLTRVLKGALIGAAVGAVVGYTITSPCALGHGDDFTNGRITCTGGRQFGAVVFGAVGFVVGIPLGALLR